VESAVHEVDLSDEWAALTQELEAPTEEPAAAPVDDAPADHSDVPATPFVAAPDRLREEVLAEPPAYDLELQPAAPTSASQSDTLSADALFADLAEEFESATASLGIPEEMGQQAAPPPAQPPIARETEHPKDQKPVKEAAAPAAPARCA